MTQKIPETASYRIHVEKWYNYFAKTCMENEDVSNEILQSTLEIASN